MGFFSRNKEAEAERTRFFFATDLHSSEACFRKLLATPRVYELDKVICGCDCTGKMLIPLVEQGQGSGEYLVEWGGESVVARGEEKVAEHEKEIRYAGLDALHRTVDIGTGMGGVRIVIARDAGTLIARLADLDGKPLPSANVWVIPQSAAG